MINALPQDEAVETVGPPPTYDEACHVENGATPRWPDARSTSGSSRTERMLTKVLRRLEEVRKSASRIEQTQAAAAANQSASSPLQLGYGSRANSGSLSPPTTPPTDPEAVWSGKITRLVSLPSTPSFEIEINMASGTATLHELSTRFSYDRNCSRQQKKMYYLKMVRGSFKRLIQRSFPRLHLNIRVYFTTLYLWVAAGRGESVYISANREVIQFLHNGSMPTTEFRADILRLIRIAIYWMLFQEAEMEWEDTPGESRNLRRYYSQEFLKVTKALFNELGGTDAEYGSEIPIGTSLVDF